MTQMDDLKARLLHGEGQDWDLPYATRKEAHDYIEALEAQLAAARGEPDRIVAYLRADAEGWKTDGNNPVAALALFKAADAIAARAYVENTSD